MGREPGPPSLYLRFPLFRSAGLVPAAFPLVALIYRWLLVPPYESVLYPSPTGVRLTLPVLVTGIRFGRIVRVGADNTFSSWAIIAESSSGNGHIISYDRSGKVDDNMVSISIRMLNCAYSPAAKKAGEYNLIWENA